MNDMKKCLKIIALQKGLKLKDIASKLGITVRHLSRVCKQPDKKIYKKLKVYVTKNLVPEHITPKISAIIHGMTYKEYADKYGVDYSQMLYYEAYTEGVVYNDKNQ